MVKNDDGFKAWQKLHMHFGPSLSAKQGMALRGLQRDGGETRDQARETKSLIAELERRIKMVEEVTGRVDQRQPRQVGVGRDT